jgi:hypothetical protein
MGAQSRREIYVVVGLGLKKGSVANYEEMEITGDPFSGLGKFYASKFSFLQGGAR